MDDEIPFTVQVRAGSPDVPAPYQGSSDETGKSRCPAAGN